MLKLKVFAWFVFFLCTTALSCWKLEGFPTSGSSQDFTLSKPVVSQGQEIHVLRHAGLNRKVGLEAKSDIFVSSKAGHGGKGGGSNIAHLPGRQLKNSASSLGRPPIFLLSAAAIFHLSLGVILAFPSLLLKLF